MSLPSQCERALSWALPSYIEHEHMTRVQPMLERTMIRTRVVNKHSYFNLRLLVLSFDIVPHCERLRV